MKFSGKTFNPATTVRFQTLLLTGALTCASGVHAALLINEVDYDQPGSDTAEFIELFNNGGDNLSLDGYSIDLINGSNSSVYRSIDLSGFSIDSGAYFVVCGNSALVANCDYAFTSTSGWLQNGAPDAMALYNNQQDTLDSLSYEGNLFPYTENASILSKDSNSTVMSLSRLPNGFDSNANNIDFDRGCLTPGSANIAGTGDCSLASASVIPVPAAAWLFGSGLIGLAGIGRNRQLRQPAG